jgi:hypothetical protein
MKTGTIAALRFDSGRWFARVSSEDVDPNLVGEQLVHVQTGQDEPQIGDPVMLDYGWEQWGATWCISLRTPFRCRACDRKHPLEEQAISGMSGPQCKPCWVAECEARREAAAVRCNYHQAHLHESGWRCLECRAKVRALVARAESADPVVETETAWRNARQRIEARHAATEAARGAARDAGSPR